ncbi:hypothetical protein MFRU_008g01260 [Monilinia fructicola]|uniref:Uncharacterized protein n=1 Tax=Monilinia fructicola TaxID=38448 RepID=A0A5M9J6C8_MONFR|nr:hypothetical protein EYC84_010807 [Monilinia fructicola]KAG4031764.1 hypothetical protein MFRU_008g01260 [Monilinia fructicola]
MISTAIHDISNAHILVCPAGKKQYSRLHLLQTILQVPIPTYIPHIPRLPHSSPTGKSSASNDSNAPCPTGGPRAS